MIQSKKIIRKRIYEPSEDSFITPSDVARICLSCDPKIKCKGDCKRFREQNNKLKELKNER